MKEKQETVTLNPTGIDFDSILNYAQIQTKLQEGYLLQSWYFKQFLLFAQQVLYF